MSTVPDFRTITRLLVANRGEIARRVFVTCRTLGIQTVAVHSEADAGLPFVREADLAVLLPGTEASTNSPAETYLRADLIIEAARKTGADAIHPGYGFLSENAAFARAVIEAGLVWVGPAPESIEAMGSKVAAKKLMADAGVPVFAELDPAAVTEADLPVLVKASAGGGGRGMRVVRSLDSLCEQVALAADEAGSAFGDATVFVEPYLEHGRHIEVQVIGDAHGHIVVLGERDCSLQRRHQKVLEESPAPGISDHVRSTLHEGARTAAAAIGYVGAGTVEFMVAGDRVSFLEMNTRLQVEHPVTEAVFGVDLVALQLAVAEGGSLAELAPGRPQGHAVEVRLYAEDPAADWQPQSGALRAFEVEHDAAFAALDRHGIRLDSGFEAGSEVGTHYDAMLAKVIAWGPDRATAFRSLAGVLRRARLHGLTTNRDLLVALLGDPTVLRGEMTTDYLTEAAAELVGGASGTKTQQAQAFFAAAVAVSEADSSRRPVQRGVPSGWRNVASAPQLETFELAGTEVPVGWWATRSGFALADPENETTGVTAHEVRAIPGGWQVTVEHDGISHPHHVFLDGDHVDVESPAGHLALTRLPRFTDPADQVASGSLLAPMPGTVIDVRLQPGAAVSAGDTVLVLEAMKMQHSIKAPGGGVLTALAVQQGQQVAAGEVLAVVEGPETTEATQGASR